MEKPSNKSMNHTLSSALTDSTENSSSDWPIHDNLASLQRMRDEAREEVAQNVLNNNTLEAN